MATDKCPLSLHGEWDNEVDFIVHEVNRIVDIVGNALIASKAPESSVALDLLNDACAISGTIIDSCRRNRPTSKQAVAALLRTQLEAFINILAFCIKPSDRAAMFEGFKTILRYRIICNLVKHPKAPFYTRNTSAWAEKKRQVQEEITADRGRFANFLPPKKLNLLQQALESPGKFRKTWYPEDRRQILCMHEMEWLYDVEYSRLSSAVHSDGFATLAVSGTNRTTPGMVTILVLGAAVHQLSNAMSVELDASDCELLKWCYNSLQPDTQSS